MSFPVFILRVGVVHHGTFLNIRNKNTVVTHVIPGNADLFSAFSRIVSGAFGMHFFFRKGDFSKRKDKTLNGKQI